MPPPAGNYFIQNKASGRYLKSKGKDDRSGTPVFTAKAPHKFDDSFGFNVRKDEGDMYVISANKSGVNIGTSPSLHDGSPAAWTVGEQPFKILDDGSGYYGVRLMGEDRFWNDGVAKRSNWHEPGPGHEDEDEDEDDGDDDDATKDGCNDDHTGPGVDDLSDNDYCSSNGNDSNHDDDDDDADADGRKDMLRRKHKHKHMLLLKGGKNHDSAYWSFRAT